MNATVFSFAAVVATSVFAMGCSDDDLPPLMADCTDPECMHSSLSGPRSRAVGSAPPTGNQGSTTGGGIVLDAGPNESGVNGNGVETLPEAGPGPGIGPATNGNGTQGIGPENSTQLGPVCPANAPSNGAPCDATANTLPCSYARLSCFCASLWVCM